MKILSPQEILDKQATSVRPEQIEIINKLLLGKYDPKEGRAGITSFELENAFMQTDDSIATPAMKNIVQAWRATGEWDVTVESPAHISDQQMTTIWFTAK